MTNHHDHAPIPQSQVIKKMHAKNKANLFHKWQKVFKTLKGHQGTVYDIILHTEHKTTVSLTSSLHKVETRYGWVKRKGEAPSTGNRKRVVWIWAFDEIRN